LTQRQRPITGGLGTTTLSGGSFPTPSFIAFWNGNDPVGPAELRELDRYRQPRRRHFFARTYGVRLDAVGPRGLDLSTARRICPLFVPGIPAVAPRKNNKTEKNRVRRSCNGADNQVLPNSKRNHL